MMKIVDQKVSMVVENKKAEVINELQGKIEKIKLVGDAMEGETVKFPVAAFTPGEKIVVTGTILSNGAGVVYPAPMLQEPSMADRLVVERAIQYLYEARALIQNPMLWIQGEAERNVLMDDEEIVTLRCAMGALQAATADTTPAVTHVAVWALANGMGEVDPIYAHGGTSFGQIAAFNDHHSHEDLMLAWKHAIHELETG